MIAVNDRAACGMGPVGHKFESEFHSRLRNRKTGKCSKFNFAEHLSRNWYEENCSTHANKSGVLTTSAEATETNVMRSTTISTGISYKNYKTVASFDRCSRRWYGADVASKKKERRKDSRGRNEGSAGLPREPIIVSALVGEDSINS
ncbi:hypothetical protein TNCV_3384031 [Trichonephila clavipes]|uniref:Uncharacterized protein n=1 Tax=Trichonephila clavipes TaxID=2585209 RepID=A0A8X6SV10_TRICX|nr:hypothetical protein TNCV_3384031 [Trichonephila clavipes]